MSISLAENIQTANELLLAAGDGDSPDRFFAPDYTSLMEQNAI